MRRLLHATVAGCLLLQAGCASVTAGWLGRRVLRADRDTIRYPANETGGAVEIVRNGSWAGVFIEDDDAGCLQVEANGCSAEGAAALVAACASVRREGDEVVARVVLERDRADRWPETPRPLERYGADRTNPGVFVTTSWRLLTAREPGDVLLERHDRRRFRNLVVLGPSSEYGYKPFRAACPVAAVFVRDAQGEPAALVELPAGGGETAWRRIPASDLDSTRPSALKSDLADALEALAVVVDVAILPLNLVFPIWMAGADPI